MVHLTQKHPLNLESFDIINDLCHLVENIRKTEEYINETKYELQECNDLCNFAWRLVERHGDSHRDLAGSLSEKVYDNRLDLEEAESELEEFKTYLPGLRALLVSSYF